MHVEELWAARVELWASRLRGVDWLAGQVLLVAAFHGLVASALLAAPPQQVVTAGTLPVLDLLPGLSVAEHRVGWAVVYLACTLLLIAVRISPTTGRQLAAWFVVIPVGFIWAGAFGIAVIDGAGSAIGLSIWVVLLCWWGTVAVGIGVRELIPHAR